MNILKLEDGFYFFNCPHCLTEIIVKQNELNCRIFRHGIMKNTYQQVNPHLSKIECEKLVTENKVIGCCKPFEIIKNTKSYVAVICEYK
jgi:hypothetical protein